MREEGVIKFQWDWEQAKPLPEELIQSLNGWRNNLFQLKLIGENEAGIGHGNISRRFDHNQFIITGSGTGSLPLLTPEHYTRVTDYDLDKNF